MNRRSLLGFLSALPALFVVKEAIASTPSRIIIDDPLPASAPNYPLGWIIDWYEAGYSPTTIHYPGHMHSIPIKWSNYAWPHGMQVYSSPVAISVKKIWDGEKFVPFDSTEGTAVLNRVLQKS